MESIIYLILVVIVVIVLLVFLFKVLNWALFTGGIGGDIHQEVQYVQQWLLLK